MTNLTLDNLNLTESDMEKLKNRSILNKKLASIQVKYGLPNLSIVQYYAKKLKIDNALDIDTNLELKLSQNALKGRKIIIKNIKEVCKVCSLNENEQENFYRLVLDNDKICEYFLSSKSTDIIDKISKYNCAGFDKMAKLLSDIDPDFDFNNYYKNNKN